MHAMYLILPLAMFSATDDAKQATEKDTLQGTWIIVAAEAEGKPVEELKGAKVTFSGEKVTFKVADHEETGTYSVDAASKPKAIDFIKQSADGTKEVDRGIYQINGHELKLCQGGIEQKRSFPQDNKATVAGESKRPKAFDSKQGVLFTLKHEHK